MGFQCQEVMRMLVTDAAQFIIATGDAGGFSMTAENRYRKPVRCSFVLVVFPITKLGIQNKTVA